MPKTRRGSEGRHHRCWQTLVVGTSILVRTLLRICNRTEWHVRTFSLDVVFVTFLSIGTVTMPIFLGCAGHCSHEALVFWESAAKEKNHACNCVLCKSHLGMMWSSRYTTALQRKS